jgi:hypothetical protein
MPDTNKVPIELRVIKVESPFPITDIGHKGQFSIRNNSDEENILKSYVVSFIATIDGKEIILKTDDSDQHELFARVSGGTFVFYTDKLGVCTDEINLSDFPVKLPAGRETRIHFYLVNIDIPESLSPYGITDAVSAQDKGCTFKIKAEINLDHSGPDWQCTAERSVMIE